MEVDFVREPVEIQLRLRSLSKTALLVYTVRSRLNMQKSWEASEVRQCLTETEMLTAAPLMEYVPFIGRKRKKEKIKGERAGGRNSGEKNKMKQKKAIQYDHQ